MKKLGDRGVAALALASAAAAFGAVLLADYLGFDSLIGTETVPGTYEKLRGNLFAGFLTLGGFMLSLKTFIVVKMKEGLYDTLHYKDRHRATGDPRRPLYQPLANLSHLLFFAIVSSLITATLQVTIGLCKPTWWSVGISLASGAGTLALLSCALLQMRWNLDDWFVLLQEAYVKDLDRQEKEEKEKEKEKEKES